MRLLVLLNPAAGGASPRAARRQIENHLGRHALAATFAETRGPGDALRLVGELASGFDMVAAAGGDGTVMETATGLVNAGPRAPVLAVLPCGTGNDLAHQLGLATMEAAVTALAQGDTRSLDTIEIDCRADNRPVRRQALVVAAAGFAATLVRLVTPRMKRYLGRRLSYWAGLFRTLATFRAPVVRLRGDDGVTSGRVLTVIAANLEHAGGGGMRVGPGADPADGRFELSVVRALSRARILGQLRHVARGTHVRHPAVRFTPATWVEIDGDPPMEVMADGDPLGTTPAVFRLRPAAIRVVAPRT